MRARDIGASVRQRLLNQSRASARPFQELLQYYAMERFLYRLANSRFADRFILKGALLLTAWRAPLSRPTVDIDLSGKTNNELAHIRSLIADVCSVAAEPDGIEFNTNSIEVARIREGAEYEGVRVKFHATLARARIPMQIDIGFGDVIVPGPVEVSYPTLLEFPAPVLAAYPKETVVAEKLEALTALGLLNSRMKDYYDLALLSRIFSFEGRLLTDAIRATFSHRGTEVEPDPAGLSDAFYSEPARAAQWRAFFRRSRLSQKAAELNTVAFEIRRFVEPPLSAVAFKKPFDAAWRAGGPWTESAPHS